jgi:hypothetical protein
MEFFKLALLVATQVNKEQLRIAGMSGASVTVT